MDKYRMKAFKEPVLRVGLTLILHSSKRMLVGHQDEAVEKSFQSRNLLFSKFLERHLFARYNL